MAREGFPSMDEFRATVPKGGLLDPSLRKNGGVGINMGKMKSDCATPGMKIRSKGKGRGLARGRGRGPIGIPFGSK